MKSDSRFARSLILLFLSSSFALAACDARAGASSLAAGESGLRGPIEDAPLAAFQSELLDLAFDTASSLPTNPHVKNRARAQDSVVATCLELDQPRRALGYIERIDNWRRGSGYADLAAYCAEHDDAVDARRYMDLAFQLAANVDEEDTADWQRERIQSKVARTAAILERKTRASEATAGLAGTGGANFDAKAFDAELAALDPVIATGGFDEVRGALEACTQLYDRAYDDEIRRERAEGKIKASWKPLPIAIRVELLMQLAESALAHADPNAALDLTRESVRTMDGAKWVPEAHITLQARLARLLHRSGDTAAAHEQLALALARYEANDQQIVDIYRAGALRSLAEAHQALGDTAVALAVFERAVEAGVLNPNSRPRAEDLAATCCSLASARIDPGVKLGARIREIRGSLGDPW